VNDSLTHADYDERRPGAALAAILICALIGAIAIAALTAAIWYSTRPAPAAAAAPMTLAAARLDCDPSVFTATLADGDRTLLVAADDQRGRETLDCLADRLTMPAAVYSQITTTRALDGRQAAAWDGYRASWTYHPTGGLNMIIEVTS
jgi:hypothetical protein